MHLVKGKSIKMRFGTVGRELKVQPIPHPTQPLHSLSYFAYIKTIPKMTNNQCPKTKHPFLPYHIHFNRI